jgi:hypothetical protein
MSTTNIFETAARNKIRFASTKGLLTVEQLFNDVPLRSTDGFNLDAVAREANRQLKAATEESFVNTERTPEHSRLETTLEIVKFVIASKLDDEAAAKKRQENAAEKQKLLKILAEKQDGKLSELSEAQLRRRIEALS